MKTIDQLTDDLLREINTLSQLEKSKDDPMIILSGIRRMVTKIYKTGYAQGLSIFQSFTDEHKN